MVKVMHFKESGLKVIKITGEAGETDLKKLKDALRNMASCSEIMLDLAGVHYISSDFTGFLLKIRNENPRHYAKIKLLNPNEAVRGMLEMTDIAKLFDIQAICPTAW